LSGGGGGVGVMVFLPTVVGYAMMWTREKTHQITGGGGLPKMQGKNL